MDFGLSEPLHRSGRKLLLWFEPQRVCDKTAWASFQARATGSFRLRPARGSISSRNRMTGTYPTEIALGNQGKPTQPDEPGDRLWNMGEPVARRFLTDWLSARIDEFGLDWYREDFNIAPLEYWQQADARIAAESRGDSLRGRALRDVGLALGTPSQPSN